MTAAVAPAGSTARLATFAADVRPADLPPDVRHQAARLLLDTVGCLLGGHATVAGRLGVRWAAAGSPGDSSGRVASILGTHLRLPPALAAYANGRLAAVLDADETWPSARQVAHLAAASVSAALAACERSDASRDDLLTAIAVGYEIGARLSDAMLPAGEPGVALKAGWGPGSPIGATVAAARGLALDARGTAHAIGIAGTHVDPPPLQWTDVRPAPMAKSADAGWHAMTGVAGAEMAELGLTGYPGILDGERGLWRALGYAGCDASALLDGLGTDWRVLDTAFKRWPCQYWMHPALTALEQVLRDHRPDPDAIEAIRLETNPKSLAARFHDPAPPSEIDRAFSFPHAAAMLVLAVPPGLAWLSETQDADLRVRRLRERVTVAPHADAERIGEWVVRHGFRDLPARATVVVGDTAYVAEARLGRGAPWSAATRLDDAELVRKARELVGPLVDGHAGRAGALDAAADWMLDGGRSTQVRELTALLAPLVFSPLDGAHDLRTPEDR